MDRQDMIRRFSQKNGSLFINRKEIAECMGFKDSHLVGWIISGLERTKEGKRYYIPDVVGRIMSETEVKG